MVHQMKSWPLVLSLLAALPVVPAAAAPQRAAVFDFEMIDTSLSGEMNGKNPAETQRLVKAAQDLRAKLAASDRYQIVDIALVAEKAHGANLQACGGCDAAFARELGADVAITGIVQKVSDMILNMTIIIRDAATAKVIAAASADMQGSSDENWSRAVNFIVRNRLLASKEGAAQ